MISRTTRNKSFMQQQRTNSCCRWFEGEEKEHQLRLTFDKKKTPIKLYNNTSKFGWKNEIPEERGYATPIKMNQTVRKSSGNSNENSWGTARTTDQNKLESLVTLPSSQAARNPLQRLHRHHKKKTNGTAQKLTIGITTARPISFNYVTPKKQINLRQTMSTGIATMPRTEQPQKVEQNELEKEIQTYRREYEQLLREYSELRKRKQTNLSMYRSLLAKLKAKKDEIVALQKLRRQQIEELRLQIQQVIAERENMQNMP